MLLFQIINWDDHPSSRVTSSVLFPHYWSLCSSRRRRALIIRLFHHFKQLENKIINDIIPYPFIWKLGTGYYESTVCRGHVCIKFLKLFQFLILDPLVDPMYRNFICIKNYIPINECYENRIFIGFKSKILLLVKILIKITWKRKW